MPLGDIPENLTAAPAIVSWRRRQGEVVGLAPRTAAPVLSRSFPLCSRDFPGGSDTEARKRKRFDLFVLKPE